MFSNNNFHSICGSLDLDLTCCDVIRGADASPRIVMTPLARCWLLPPRPHCFCLFCFVCFARRCLPAANIGLICLLPGDVLTFFLDMIFLYRSPGCKGQNMGPIIIFHDHLSSVTVSCLTEEMNLGLPRKSHVRGRAPDLHS